MHHNPRDISRTVDMVPALKHNSLMSERKSIDTKYVTVLTLEEVLIYGVNEVKLRALGQAILPGWRCKTIGLWRVSLKPKVENENVDTMLLKFPDPGKSTNNIYELPRTKQSIKYLYACSGSPTKAT